MGRDLARETWGCRPAVEKEERELTAERGAARKRNLHGLSTSICMRVAYIGCLPRDTRVPREYLSDYCYYSRLSPSTLFDSTLHRLYIRKILLLIMSSHEGSGKSRGGSRSTLRLLRTSQWMRRNSTMMRWGIAQRDVSIGSIHMASGKRYMEIVVLASPKSQWCGVQSSMQSFRSSRYSRLTCRAGWECAWTSE
ncbi:hypothetical protein Scep_023995 [Stephania cephalantha]|uniref:Uncharacterized protein n=1 Tax=Stephania cephalantha TaxID=152367 RepID=A0AAP0EYH2_9MAGN